MDINLSTHENTNRPVELSVRSAQQSEIASLAHQLMVARRQALEYYRTKYQPESAEADTTVQDMSNVSAEIGEAGRVIDDVTYGLPQTSSWYELECLAEHDPYRMVQRWQEINQAALDELISGHRAAIAVAVSSGETPWDRAQFLALRACLDQWGPCRGVELLLIDVMAQAQTLYYHWIGVLIKETGTAVEHRKSNYSPIGIQEPPRVSDVQAMEVAAAMVDRLNRLFLRTLRQLRDLRRYAPPVMIQSAGQVQVNIAGQQMNVSSAELED